MTRRLDYQEMLKLKRIVGDIGDLRLAAILALDPRQEEVEEAVIWADDLACFAEECRLPLSQKVGEILKILTSPDPVSIH